MFQKSLIYPDWQFGTKMKFCLTSRKSQVMLEKPSMCLRNLLHLQDDNYPVERTHLLLVHDVIKALKLTLGHKMCCKNRYKFRRLNITASGSTCHFRLLL